MSLSVDGTWKAGVWATTVWKAGVWREGAATTTRAEFSQYGVAFPPESPGPAPRLGNINAQADREFYALAKLTEIDIYLQEVMDLVGDEALVDVNEDPFRPDDDLFGRTPSNGTRRKR